MHPEIARQLHEQRLRDQQRRRPVIDRMAAGPTRACSAPRPLGAPRHRSHPGPHRHGHRGRAASAGRLPMTEATGSPQNTRSPISMALLRRELTASFAFIERNFFLTRRYWGWEIAWLIYATTSALSIAFIGVEQERPRPRPDAHDRGRLLELPVHRLRLHRRDGRLGALGGHAGVHLHGSHPALDAAARLDGLRRHVRARAHGRDARGPDPLLRAGPDARRSTDARSSSWPWARSPSSASA